MALVLACAAAAHEPITTKITWSAEIARIVYQRCAACHHEGGAAPMPLVTYEEARPWAKAIRDEVLNRRMPPWGAVKGYGEFENDAGLSQPEIDIIVQWVEGGAPEGDAAHLPVMPVFSDPPAPGTRLPAPQTIAPGRVRRAVRLAAIQPLEAAASIEVRAYLPGGAVLPLAWLQRPPLTPFVLRRPLKLPAGSRVAAYGGRVALLVY